MFRYDSTNQIKEKKKRFERARPISARSNRSLLDEVKSLAPLKRVSLDEGFDLDKEIKSYEIRLIEQALDQTDGNQALAARLLNLKHTTLNAKIKRYAIHKSKVNGNFGYG